MKNILIIFFLFLGYNVVAQNNPSGVPTQFSTGWFRQGWHQSDSGEIIAPRIPNFTPRFPGTTILYQNAGIDTSIHYWTGGRWIKINPTGTDTTSLSNRINLKLNITDTTAKWWGIGKRWVDTVYRVNDSTIGYTINGGAQQTFEIKGGAAGGGGSGTVTSVALSMPSAFSVTGSPITTSGTFNITGAGTTLDYIRGNGTLATTDTGMIPNFYLKVRGLLTGTSPITFNQFTGAIGINNANTSGTKGAASFTSEFSDNGSGLIDLSDLVSAGSCTGCILNINAKGRITGYSDGPAGATNNVNIGSGFRILNAVTQEMRTLYAGAGTSIDSVANADGLTFTSQNISNASLTADGTYAQNWNNKQWYVDSIAGQFLFRMGGVGSTGTRRKDFRINWGGSSFGNNLDGYNIMTTINKADNSGDSLRLGLISSGTGVLSMGYYDVANSANNTFISYSQSSGLINISAKDSIWVKGVVAAATADSVLGVVNVGTNGTGKLVKFPVPSGGGIPALNYKYVGFGSIGNMLSPGEAEFGYDSIINALYVDSVINVETRSDWTTYNQAGVVDTLAAYGNSITVGSNASPIDSAYINRMSAQLQVPLNNYAISGRGVQTAAYLNFVHTGLLHNNMTTVDAGFNDIRNNNILSGLSGRKTQNKIINCHVSIIANNYLESFISLSGGLVTRYGSWTTNWPATSEGGKTTTAIFTSSVNDSVTYAFTGSTVVIGAIGQDNISQSGSDFTYYIDGSVVGTGSTDNQSDGIDDGSGFGGDRIPMAVIIAGLTDGPHTLKVVNNGSGTFILDYFGHLRDADLAPPMLIFHATYMNAAGYAATPNSSVAATDTMNLRLDSLRNALPLPYRDLVSVVHVENCYDTLTGLSGDNVHPNNTGHGQIFNCALPFIQGGLKPEGSMFYASGYPYFQDGSGAQKMILGTGTIGYVPVFSLQNKIINSSIQYDGTNIGIDQAPGTYKVSITGTLRTTADALFATNSGNVGIGTTSPGTKLDVNGFGNFQGQVSSRGSLAGFSLESRQSGTFAWGIYADNAALKFLAANSPSINHDRVKMWLRGGMTIANSTETSTTDLGNTLDIHGSVRISKDSVQIIPSITSQYVLVIDTTSGADSGVVKRILASNFSGGITTLNTLTASTQTFATGTSGTDFNISSSSSTHTFNIPSASTSNRGLVTTTSQTLGGSKTFNDGIIVTSPTAFATTRLQITGNISLASAPGISGVNLYMAPFTFTNSSGAGTETNGQNFNLVAAPTLTSSNAISYTGDVTTINFTGAPIAAGSTTISHPWNIFASDVSRFAGIAMALNEQSADATLATASGVNIYDGAGGNTWTLPALATHPGKFIFIKNAGSGNLTVQRAGSDNIYNTSSVTSITVAAGADVVLAAGSAFWYVIGF